MIKLSGLHLQLGSKVLLADAELAIFPGQKWGLIGANGSGKSSLFKLLLGEVHEDKGELSLPGDWQLAHMAQEVHSSEQSALDFVLDGDKGLRMLEKRIAEAGHDGDKLARLYEEMEHIDGYSASARAQKLLHGLGFTPGEEHKAVRNFSGGWRIRLNLAQALMCRSDLLLLDEPTNHLDLDACVWLESWLQSYQGTLLIISHDRDFLDNVIDNIVSIENQTLACYKGNYSAYETQKAARLAQQQASYEKQQQRVADIESFVRRFKAKASKAKQAQSRLKELQRMELIAPAHVDSPFSFRFPQPERLPQTLLTLSQADIGYINKVIVANIEFGILASSRLGILGHNGEGKSTLLKTLAQQIPCVAGELHTHEHLRIGYFSQHQLEALDLQASALLHLQRLDKKASEQAIRTFLGSFGFQGERVFEIIHHFSGGEKARLALAILAWQKPNLLLLDEPTNHLDLEVRHALTLALQAWEGPMILISHDRHLLRNTVDEFILVDSGRLQEFDGDLSDYQNWLLTSKNTQQQSNAPVLAENDKKVRRQQAAAQRENIRSLSNAIKKLEQEIEKLTTKLTKTEALLSGDDIYTKDKDRLPDMLQEQGNLKTRLQECEVLWLEKNEELEILQGNRSAE